MFQGRYSLYHCVCPYTAKHRGTHDGTYNKTETPSLQWHHNDVMASQITSLATVYSTVYFGTEQRKCQSSTSLALVRRIHRWPVNFPHKEPVTRKMFPFDDVIMVAKGMCLGSYIIQHVGRSLTHWDRVTHVWAMFTNPEGQNWRLVNTKFSLKFPHLIYLDFTCPGANLTGPGPYFSSQGQLGDH